MVNKEKISEKKRRILEENVLSGTDSGRGDTNTPEGKRNKL